ncbi:MAG: hypothetical protein WBB74_00370 [Gaiellaceae bacterium]
MRPLRLAAPALIAYIAARALGLLVLWLMARHFDESVPALLGRWDGRWFLGIVQHGYDTSLAHGPNGKLVNSNIVFFPGYPYLVKGVATVTSLRPLYAGILTSSGAGIAAAWGIFAIGNQLYGRKAGILLAFLWGIQTHAVVESMVYSEGLFTALAAWCLYTVLRRRWLTAGALCLLAGVTRAAAVVLVAIVVVAAVAAVVRRQDGWRPWVGALFAPVGVLGYWAWVAHVLGRTDGWFYMQHYGWHAQFDAGRTTWHTFVHRVLVRPTWFEFYEVTAVLLAAVVLFGLLVLLRPPWPLIVYAAGILVIALGAANYYHSKARFLLPAFPLLLPIAVGLARADRRTIAALLPPLALASAWYGSYLLLIWKHSF